MNRVQQKWVSDQGLWGRTKMSKKFGIPESELARDLPSIEAYQRTVPERHRDKKFAKIVAIKRGSDNRDDQWQGDLLDIETTKRGRTLNKGVRFICMYIDVYSRKIFAQGIKKKTTASIMAYSKPLLTTHRPHNLTYDRESAIRSNAMQSVLKALDIKLWHPEKKQPNDFKGATAIVERANRTIRHLITKWKVAFKNKAWINSLDNLIRNYNSTPHGAFKNKQTPDQVYNKQNSGEDQTRTVENFEKGQKVRIRLTRTLFQKHTDPEWSREVYTVQDKVGEKYRVLGPDGKMRKHRLGPQDLKKVPGNVFSVRRSRRGRAVDNLPDGNATFLSLSPIRKPFTEKPKPKKPRRSSRSVKRVDYSGWF